MTNEEFNNLILDKYLPLKRFAYQLTNNKDDALDLVQDTYYKALLYKDKLVDTTNCNAWLFTILKNNFINKYRCSKHTPISYNIEYDSLQYVIPSNVPSIQSNLHTIELEAFINQLNDDIKIPFQMYITGYKYKEISEKLSIKIGTIKARIFIARKQLMNDIRNDNLNLYNMNKIEDFKKETDEISVKKLTDKEYAIIHKHNTITNFILTVKKLIEDGVTSMNKITLETNISWPTMLDIMKAPNPEKLSPASKTLAKMDKFIETHGKITNKVITEKVISDRKEDIKITKIENKVIEKESKDIKFEIKPLTFWEAIGIAHQTKPSNITIHIQIN